VAGFSGKRFFVHFGIRLWPGKRFFVHFGIRLWLTRLGLFGFVFLEPEGGSFS